MTNKAINFRFEFENLAPQAVVSRTELASLLNVSEGAVSQMLYRGELPAVAFPEKRRSVWFAGDLKQWLDEKRQSYTTVKAETLPLTSSHGKKIGRPRNTLERLR